MDHPEQAARRDVIVIGASSGGVEALTKLVGGLPSNLPAAIFVVQHTSPEGPSLLGKILDRSGPLSARMAQDGDRIVPGTILVAPPDHHLVLTPERVVLDRGPAENRSRPAIDVLFRSAAMSFGARVIGVVLSGNLSDGSIGLRAIKSCGGKSVVQDPGEATFPDMPRNAILKDSPDHVVSISSIAPLLAALTRERVSPVPVPEQVVLEGPRGLRLGQESVGINDRLGDNAPYSCPDCGGPLWRVDDSVIRYRCVTGHALTADVLLAAKGTEIERALQYAVRTLDERARLLGEMAIKHQRAGHKGTASICEKRQDEAAEAARTVSGFLSRLTQDDES